MSESPAEPAKERKMFSHDRSVNGKEEWLTPPWVIKALGEFDLDPCSPTPETRPWDTAKNHFCIRDDGLNQPWVGRVFCNPPYGSKTGDWLKKCAEHKNCTALIFARTETRMFFDHIWPCATAILFIKGRLAFYHVTGVAGDAAGAPSCLITWDDANADALKDAVMHGRIEGAFIDLRKQ